ncbi:MAG: DNA polymerase ligase N-terminal domain-containing protein [Bacteroidota bacterium]|nr:DNA polymerase ligase N-terminal domain-containing protein [Bacteroidota bacterium]MDP4233146.1 DNA polymerase ligase N-terminal domain-containing protein [Bacteroidota bacterium]MDP4241709.1 DNA polymerase ligase N-terminal domain-containing protein [Bacteroidota bacterium]MDP4287367.1 DNA polymerase ligase N-terminal domain-containing protein [Bacteroidota bacterium]
MPLNLYHKKRNFAKTSEPKGKKQASNKRRFLIHEHHATQLHFDFRMEMEGVLKSWAVPKGPSMNPNDKHLAVMVEDHPIEYGSFEGTIPEGEYGAGEVRIWDKGTYEPVGDTPVEEQIKEGKLTFILMGKKLKGEFHMVEMKGRGENNWLLFKHKDEYADPNWELDPILHYGSRTQAPGKKKNADIGEHALERLVEKSKTKSAAAASKPRARSTSRPSVKSTRDRKQPRGLKATVTKPHAR